MHPQDEILEKSDEDSKEMSEKELGPVSMEELGEETESDSEDVFEVSSEEKSDVIDIDGTDIFDEESDPIHDIYFEECFNALGINARAVTRYQKECYLKFGFDDAPYANFPSGRESMYYACITEDYIYNSNSSFSAKNPSRKGGIFLMPLILPVTSHPVSKHALPWWSAQRQR